MKKISKEKKIKLRKLAHHLKPIILIGQKGLTDAVELEIERALYDHELIKIHVAGADKQERQTMVDKICLDRDAMLIQAIGNVAVIYRKREE